MSYKQAFLTVAATFAAMVALAVLPPDLRISLAVACAYFAPTILATIRKVPHLGSVIVINTFLGWTFVGWVVALAIAARSVPSQTLTP